MSYITTYPLRKPTQFFGQDCYPQKLAHESIERERIETENAILRKESASWKRQAQEALAGQAEIALRLAEVMERESAMVAAISQHEAIDKLRLAQLERADAIQTTQRIRIDELTRDRDEASEQIIDQEAALARFDARLRAVRGECDA